MNLYVFRKKKLRFICKERDREWEKGIEIGRKKATLTQNFMDSRGLRRRVE